MKPRRLLPIGAVLATAAMVAVLAPSAQADKELKGHHGSGPNPASIHLQDDFDPIGPQVHSLKMASGRVVHYIDEGDPSWKPFVYLSGQGTSLQSAQLTEFARSTREALHLRMISIERNGFGESDYDSELGYEDYDNEVLAVLDHLKIKRFAIEAVSGGGAYAAHLAARVPTRVTSLHLASVSPSTLPTRGDWSQRCARTPEQVDQANLIYTHNPKIWWAEPADDPVQTVPGWQDEAYLDAARSFFVNGQLGAPDALTHETLLPCQPGAVVSAAALHKVRAPAYLYWGAADTTVPPTTIPLWKAALPNIVATRVYAGEGHTVQYRHWDQILVDMAGMGDYTVVCTKGHTRLEKAKQADKDVKRGATLGLCAWQTGAVR